MIVLDTHAWLWFTSAPQLLSKKASVAIDDASELAISAFSVWEVALLAQRGRIRTAQPTPAWIHAALQIDRRIRQVSVDSAIAMRAIDARARGLEGDPADQIIVATAEHLDVPLVSKNAAIKQFSPARVVW